MSRSRKKHPVTTVALCRAGTMKFYKKCCDRKIRKREEDIPDGSYYKRLNGKHYSIPHDGKMYLCRNDRKKYPNLYEHLESTIYRK